MLDDCLLRDCVLVHCAGFDRAFLLLLLTTFRWLLQFFDRQGAGLFEAGNRYIYLGYQMYIQ